MKPYLKIQKHEALGNYLPENDFKSCSTVNLRRKKNPDFECLEINQS